MNVAFRARLEPERPALFWRGRWTSYGELDRDITLFGGRMRALGVEPGDRVSVLAPNHPVHLHALYAAARGGWIHAPLNTRLPPAEVAAMLEYLGSKVVVCGAGFEAHAETVGERLPGLEVVWLDVFDQYDVGVYRIFVPPHPDDTRMLLFTGGTTGAPKAARITNRMFDANAWDTVAGWGLTPEDATVLATPMFHAGVNALATPLLEIGGRVAILEGFSPAAYLDLAAASGATILFAVPTMFGMIAEAPEFTSADFSSVRYAITGGSNCPERVRETFERRGVRFKLGYGMTEAGVNCFSISLADAARKPGAVGRPMPRLEAVVRGPHGEAVPPGVVGELTLRGPQVTPGYWERPRETAEALRELPGEPGGPFLFTGDLARVDEDGAYFIVGRRKEMFISGGENVYPAEVERAVYEHPAVLECAVVGVVDERWGEVGLAAVVVREGASLDAAGLREHLRGRLAGYALPKHLALHESLPKSAAGKVLKREIAARFEAARLEVPS